MSEMTPLQFAISEITIVFDAARNVLEPAEHDVFIAVAIALVARRAAEVAVREWDDGEWRKAA